MSYIYIGCFLDPRELLSATREYAHRHLARIISAPHVTFQYQPEEVDEALFGQPVEITVLGYGNDGENEGLLVQLTSPSPAVQAMAEAIPVPHITISVSETGKPVNTGGLSFREIPPFRLTGVFGGYQEGGVVVTRS